MPPILTRDFTVILDAQKTRGNEIEWVDSGLFTQIHRIAPLIIPVTIGSIMCGDNMVNAKACISSNCTFVLGSNYKPIIGMIMSSSPLGYTCRYF